MKKKIFIFILINFAVTSIILLFLSFYMIRIVDNSNIKKTVNDKFDSIEKEIEKNQTEFDNILAQVSDDNLAKARAVAIILNQSGETYLANESIEELRVVLDVEEILITDEKGIVFSGTSPYIGQNFNSNDIYKQFLPAINNKSFFKIVNDVQTNTLVQNIGVARLDKPGVIYIKASNYYLENSIKQFGISSVVRNHNVLKSGSLSIINKEKWEYVSHTDSKMVGTTVQIPKDKFKNLEDSGKGDFKISMQGKNMYTFYREYKDYVIMAQVNTNEVFSRRNYVTISILITLLIIGVIFLLALRDRLLNVDITDKNKAVIK